MRARALLPRRRRGRNANDRTACAALRNLDPVTRGWYGHITADQQVQLQRSGINDPEKRRGCVHPRARNRVDF